MDGDGKGEGVFELEEGTWLVMVREGGCLSQRKERGW